jgi:hypothetical protein
MTWLFASAEGGVCPADSWNILEGRFHKLLIATGSIIPNLAAASLNQETLWDLTIPVFGGTGVQAHRRWNRFALCGDTYDEGFGYLRDLKVGCRRMLLPKSEYEAIETGNIIARYLWDRVTEESANDNWIVVRSGDCPEGDHSDLLSLSDRIPKNSYYPTIIEWHLSESQTPLEDLKPSPLARLWREKLPHSLIPFDLGARLKLFATAYSEMKDLITAHEQELTQRRIKERESPRKTDA